MFGYILPQKEELKVREYYHFRAYYCGVCLALKKRYGQLSRLFLNYDVTFLSILLAAISLDEEKVVINRCIYTLSRRPMINEHPAVNFAADLAVLLTYQKLADDWQDEKSFLAKIGMLLLHKNYQKVSKIYPEENTIIEEGLEKLSSLEKAKSPDFLKAAAVFGEMLAGIIIKRGQNSNEEKVLERFAFLLGQWIYLIDALDDLPNDVQKSNYNPFLLAFAYADEDIIEFKKRITPQVKDSLVDLLAEMANTYDLFETKRNQELIENIIYVGMLNKTEDVLAITDKRSCKKHERLSWYFRCKERCK